MNGNEEVVIIPGGIKTIESRAFSDNGAVKTVVIPDGVEKIESYAFYMCRALQVVVFPKTLQEIGEYAFAGCSGITKIELNEGLRHIGDSAFQGCVSLKQISLPDSLETFSRDSFPNYDRIRFSISKESPAYQRITDLVSLAQEKQTVRGYTTSDTPLSDRVRERKNASPSLNHPYGLESGPKAEEKPGKAGKEAKPKKRGGGCLVVLLVLIALGALGYFGWQRYGDMFRQLIRNKVIKETVQEVAAYKKEMAEDVTEVAAANETLVPVEHDPELLGEQYRIRNLTAEASDHITGKSGYEYVAEFCIDNEPSTSWQMHNEPDRHGTVIVSFPESKTLKYIRYWGGNAKSGTKYGENNRPQTVKVTLLRNGGEESSHEIEFADLNEYQLLEVTSAGLIDGVSFEIRSVYSGSKYDDTCISELEFYSEDIQEEAGEETGSGQGDAEETSGVSSELKKKTSTTEEIDQKIQAELKKTRTWTSVSTKLEGSYYRIDLSLENAAAYYSLARNNNEANKTLVSLESEIDTLCERFRNTWAEEGYPYDVAVYITDGTNTYYVSRNGEKVSSMLD